MHLDLAILLRHLPGALMLFAASTLLSQAQERDRSKMPDEYKWDLTAIYPSDQAWRTAKEKLASELPKLREFQGTLASSASRLAEALETQSHFDKEISRLFVYAAMSSDQDTRVSTYQGMEQEMIQLSSVFGTESSFIEPEILKMDNATIERFLAQEPRLKMFRHYLEDVARRRAHTLSNSEEKLLAGAGVMASGPSSVYGIFADADFPYPSVTLHDGQTVKLDKATFSLQRASLNRDDRQKVMEAFFTALGKYRATFGSMMNSNVQTSIFYAHARHYDNDLISTLDGPNIPVSVYSRLVDGVNRNLPAFHRYLKLRKRMMGLPELHYYDLYAPLVSSVDTKYSVDVAEQNILAALAPLGPEYAAGAKRAFTERWIDMFPSEGKRSGAYSNGGAYDVHPYMLLNYNGKYDDMSTLAHELGHTMHSYFSNKTQPYPLSDYPIFVAEVASTFNEALLIDYMLKQIKDDDDPPLLAGQLSGEHQGNRLPPGAIRRIRIAHARNGGKRSAPHRRRLVQALHRNRQEILRTRSGRLHRRRLHRQRMGLHPPFLQLVLRLPVRHLIHRVVRLVGKSPRRRSRSHRALPQVHFLGQIGISHRPPERRRRRHDHRRTPRPDRQKDESRHG